jgi:hypothetical protein
MSDSLKKTIQINPDFLKFSSGGKTRKKRPEKTIKMKPQIASPENNKTTKRKILNYIRKQQEDTYKNLLKEDSATKMSGQGLDMVAKSDFEKSLEFLENVVKNPEPTSNRNTTLKQRPAQNLVPNLAQNLAQNLVPPLNPFSDENVAIVPPENVFDTIVPPVFQSGPDIQLNKPKYGCLKGGVLPTYRAWKSQTQKNDTAPTASAKLTPEQNRAELRQFFKQRKDEKQRVAKAKHQVVRNKQKRTLRRTYRVGKSKVYPKIGVLVSNRTIRNQIQSKCQSLKETPIEEVKRYLVKHGFIRVGSSTPNDVLRKIYESAMLMCGEIQNHNPDNLLYNYMNHGMDV